MLTDELKYEEMGSSLTIDKDLYSREEIKQLIRDIKINDLFGHIFPDKTRIKEEYWETAKYLSDKGMTICGSMVLKLFGLIDRDVDDIDVMYDLDKAEAEGYINDDTVINDAITYDEDDYLVVGTKYRVKIKNVITGNDIHIDMFNSKAIKPCPIFSYEGVKFSSPHSVLLAKFSYFRIKDGNDYKYIRKTLDNINNNERIHIR